MDSGKPISRRDALKRLAVAIGAAAAPGLVTGQENLPRQAKVPKAALQYQDHPNGKQECDDCIHFLPGGAPGSRGACQVVAGSISPHGWCYAFTPFSTVPKR